MLWVSAKRHDILPAISACDVLRLKAVLPMLMEQLLLMSLKRNVLYWQSLVSLDQMTVDSELQQIREELYTLKVLYKRMADERIGSEKATPEEIESVEAADETVSKEEFFKLLDETPVKRRRPPVRRGC